jgi:oligosaccharyltransferase complex subunit alpha (ribophorin I)
LVRSDSRWSGGYWQGSQSVCLHWKGGKGLINRQAPTVAIDLGDIKKDGSVTLSLTYVLIHASTPLPASIEQKDAQYVDSWYPSDVERIKIRQVNPPLSSSFSLIDRSPSPKILSTGTVPKIYTRDSDLTKASSTVTLGPFHSLPPTLGLKGVEQSPFHIHYETTVPTMGYRSLKRSAEVSHWGNNLNIQDEIDLVNMGPKCVLPTEIRL